jgi:hypothetical protein
MIDKDVWDTGTQGNTQTQATSGIPDQYQGWNPGQQYQITPHQWAQWGGGDNWQPGWYRKPSDPAHVVYNEQYGYQDWPTAYGGGTLTPNWDISGFASDPDRDKANIPGYPQYEQKQQQDAWGNWQNLWNNFWGQNAQQPQTQGQTGLPPGVEMYSTAQGDGKVDVSGAGGGGSPGGSRTGGLGMYGWRPPIDMAGQVLGGYAQGIPYNAPWQWGQASDVASQFAQSGNPVDYQRWWDAQQPVLQRTIEDQSKQAAEQAGLAGSRWSTPLQRNIADISGRETANTFGNFMGMSLAGEEAAKGRQQQAINQLQGLGTGYAGLENRMRQEALQAAGMLPGVAQTGYGIQSDIAKNLMQGGMGAQGMNQQALGNLLNIWGQQNPTLAMLLQSGIGGLGTPTNWAQQQYAPSGWSQFMDNIIPF